MMRRYNFPLDTSRIESMSTRRSPAAGVSRTCGILLHTRSFPSHRGQSRLQMAKAAFPSATPRRTGYRRTIDASGSAVPSERDTARSVAETKPEPDFSSILAGKRVAICEDEGITQLQLRRIMTRAGLSVVGVAGDGRAAVELALRERPDLILMDINMPLMDGLQAAKEILSEFQACVVLLTAYGVEEYKIRAGEIGACGFIVKPVTAQSLIPQLREAYARYHSLAE